MSHTTEQDKARWRSQATWVKATHIVVCCDTFSHEDYPVYVHEGESVDEVVAKCRAKPMQSVHEVIDLRRGDRGDTGVSRSRRRTGR